MRSRLARALGAATLLAALGVSGCSSDRPASETASTVTSATSRSAAPRPGTGLPAPEALTEVLARLADPAVPGNHKLGLVEGATPADAERLDKFAKALHDSGYTPPSFEAADLAWSDATPSDVTANITANKPGDDGGFSFPMEFRPHQGAWQLARSTFDMLLNFESSETSVSSPPPR